jgi:hypothetical protein
VDEIDGRIRMIRPASAEFSPNGDGQEDVARMTYCPTRPATVTTTITPEGSPTVIRTLESARPHTGDCYATDQDSDWAQLRWGGEDDTGADVPDGRYTVHVHAVPTRGDTTPVDATSTLVVERRLPGTLTSPRTGDAIGGMADIVLTPTPGFADRIFRFYTVVRQGLGSPCWGSWGTSVGLDGKYHSVLNTTWCLRGLNTVHAEVAYFDSFSRSRTYSLPDVSVDIRTPELTLTSGHEAMTRYTGTRARVTAVLTQAGVPMGGQHVLFSIDAGPNAPRMRTATTDRDGTAEFTYYGSKPWLGLRGDSIVACLDVNANGACDPGEAYGNTNVAWAAARRMHVSLGTAANPDATHRVTIGNDTLYCDPVVFRSTLGFQYARADGSDQHTFTLTRLTSNNCSDDPGLVPGGIGNFDTMEGAGAGSLDGVPGYSIRFRLADHGEPGPASGDTIDVSITDPAGNSTLSFSAPLASGNLDAYQGATLPDFAT